jgi:hypothetical protein
MSGAAVCALALVIGILGLEGCATRDDCITAHERFVNSPSGRRRLNIFSGPCPDAVPQVLVEFDRGTGGAGVFAVDDSAAAISGRWITEDTVQIVYPAGVRVSKRLDVAQYRRGRVIVQYATAGVAR